jgi:hypothetical protein
MRDALAPQSLRAQLQNFAFTRGQILRRRLFFHKVFRFALICSEESPPAGTTDAPPGDLILLPAASWGRDRPVQEIGAATVRRIGFGGQRRRFYLEEYDAMRRPNGEYELKIHYDNDEDLDEVVSELLSDIAYDADDRHCFSESEARIEGADRHW